MLVVRYVPVRPFIVSEARPPNLADSRPNGWSATARERFRPGRRRRPGVRRSVRTRRRSRTPPRSSRVADGRYHRTGVRMAYSPVACHRWKTFRGHNIQL